jgi:hypothetical protein
MTGTSMLRQVRFLILAAKAGTQGEQEHHICQCTEILAKTGKERIRFLKEINFFNYCLGKTLKLALAYHSKPVVIVREDITSCYMSSQKTDKWLHSNRSKKME